ncbi:GntR family transcriptional regulator [Dactylosporangium roseum]|uniref:GntR family transcriptional regulator n=1 Tax=Dactylosporangium roseum TaxID=47989 RepID=A0ABY5ZB75_9ACTN|nr:GntR family transcriptional regulator [Dactylosporangium roseum]UWZ39351.1 GntR family transcriptional regulator [Dactylosporangium roseum]
MVIERRPLRDQIREEVLKRLARGDFAAGEEINLSALADELGVSRTPLREALIAMAGERILENDQGRGFRFAPVSRREYRELCVILAALESLALELSDPAHLRRIAPELLRLAQEFPDTVAEQGVVDSHDDVWHDLLLSGCTNDRLLDLITGVKAGMRRYAHLAVADEAPLRRDASEHATIARHLLDADLQGAVVVLRANWANGMERMLELIPES